METSEPTDTDARVQESYGWLRAAATGYHNAHRGHAPSVNELIAEGALLMTSLAPRYDVSHGAAFVTFCSPYVLKRWERMRLRALRETPAGSWEQLLGLYSLFSLLC